MIIPIEDIQRMAKIRGEEWKNEFLSKGTFDETKKFFTPDWESETEYEHSDGGSDQAVSVAAMAKSFVQASGKWVISGFPMCDTDTLEARLKICGGCEFWDSNGFGGTGRCQKCGCSTQAKLRMATEKCPIDKWGVST